MLRDIGGGGRKPLIVRVLCNAITSKRSLHSNSIKSCDCDALLAMTKQIATVVSLPRNDRFCYELCEAKRRSTFPNVITNESKESNRLSCKNQTFNGISNQCLRHNNKSGICLSEASYSTSSGANTIYANEVAGQKFLWYLSFRQKKDIGGVGVRCPHSATHVDICDNVGVTSTTMVEGATHREDILTCTAMTEQIATVTPFPRNCTCHYELCEAKRSNLIKKCAFTLAEVLITLGIIGVIAAMTLPTV